MGRRTGVRAAGSLCLALLSSPSYGDNRDLARDAYARGSAALDREQYVVAAREFLLADQAAPSDAALRTALEAIVRTDDDKLAAKALNRAAERSSPAVSEAARGVEARFTPRLGKIRTACVPKPCTTEIDGETVSVGAERWTTPGPHVVIGRRPNGAAARMETDVAAGRTALVSVTVSSPEEAPAPPPGTSEERGEPPRVGLSPAWFWIGAGTTVALAGVSTWSTIRLVGLRDDYKSGSCATEVSDACLETASDGKSAEIRTYVLWGATVLVGAATAAAALLWVRWPRPRAAALLRTGAVVRW